MAQVQVTGSASDVWDLLLAIKNAAVSNGFTQNEYIAGNPAMGVLRLQRNSKYYNIYAHPDDPTQSGDQDLGGALSFSISSGYTSSSTEGAQPDESSRTLMNITPGPYQNHWFFIRDEAVAPLFAGVVEFQSGYFRSFVFGECEKQGTYTGGEVVGSVWWNQSTSFIDQYTHTSHNLLFAGAPSSSPRRSSIRVDDGGVAYVEFGSGAAKKAAGNVGQYFGNPVYILGQPIYEGPNDWNERTLTSPIYLFTLDSAGSGRYKPRGQFSTVHIVNIRNYQPGDVLPGTDYKVFPVARKNDPATLDDKENSGEFGFAFKYQ
jgi:hypothetical protein